MHYIFNRVVRGKGLFARVVGNVKLHLMSLFAIFSNVYFNVNIAIQWINDFKY